MCSRAGLLNNSVCRVHFFVGGAGTGNVSQQHAAALYEVPQPEQSFNACTGHFSVKRLAGNGGMMIHEGNGGRHGS